MAIISNTFTPDVAKGLREDLSNIIYNVDPVEVPFLSKIPRTEATSPLLHEWQTDSLAAADTTNQQLQGFDVTSFAAVVPTARLGNRMTVSSKTIIISASEQKALKAGRSDEMAYQVMKRTKEIRRDIEAIMLSNQAAVAPVQGATAPKLASVLSWIKTNSNKAADGSDPAASDNTGTRTDGTVRTWTEAMLKDVCQKVYTNAGRQPDMVLVPPTLKQTASTFPGNDTRYIDAEDKKLVTAIDIYESDFGPLTIMPCRQMRGGSNSTGREALVLNSSLWKAAWFRPVKVDDLAKTGDAEKKFIVCEYSLEACNEKGSGIVADLTT